jgi:hypothetical protein
VTTSDQQGGFALDPAQAPASQPPSTAAQDPRGEGPVEPTASPGPTQQSTDTRPSDAPMPGTGPTQDVTAQAVDMPADPNEDAVLIDAGARGLTFRRSDDNGGGLFTVEIRLRGGSLAVGPFDDDEAA